MSPALNSVAFLLLSFAIGLSGKAALALSGPVERWWKGTEVQPDFAEPDALDQMLTWTGFGLLGAAFLDYFPSLHPGLASPHWAAYAGGTGFILLACAQVVHKAAVQMETEGGVNWPALGLVALGTLTHFQHVARELLK